MVASSSVIGKLIFQHNNSKMCYYTFNALFHISSQYITCIPNVENGGEREEFLEKSSTRWV